MNCDENHPIHKGIDIQPLSVIHNSQSIIQQPSSIFEQIRQSPMQQQSPGESQFRMIEDETIRREHQQEEQFIPKSPKSEEDESVIKRKSFSFNFLKVLLIKRIVNNFKTNLFQNSYILPNNLAIHQKKLLKEEYLKKKKKQYNKKKLESENTKRIFLFEHTSSFMIFLDIVKILVTVFLLWWLPFRYSFQMDYLPQYIQIQVLLFYILHSLINLNKCYIHKGQLVSKRIEILKYYLRTTALTDIISITCLAFLLFQRNQSEWLLLLVFIYVNVDKINRIMNKIEESFYFQNTLSELLSLVRLIMVIFYFAHVIACLWHYVGIYTKSTGKSWILSNELEYESALTRYNYSLYFATMTMVTVGYGDISPTNDLEVACANFTMFVACGVFAFSVNSIGIVLQNLNEQKNKFKKSLTLINNYMNKNQVTFELQGRVRNYLEYCFEQEQDLNDIEINELLDKLSKNLRQELLFEVLNKLLKCCNLINHNFSEQTKRKIASRLEPIKYTPDEVIIRQQECDDMSLYIIQKGEVVIYEENSGKQFKTLKKGDYFGEYSFLTGLNRKASVKSLNFSRIYKIKRDDFIQLLTSDERQKYFTFKEQFTFQHQEDPCYCCSHYKHQVIDCQMLQYKPDLERIIKKDNFIEFQQRISDFIRKNDNKKGQNCLRNLKFIQERSITFKEIGSNSDENQSEESYQSEQEVSIEEQAIQEQEKEDDFEEEQRSKLEKQTTIQQQNTIQLPDMTSLGKINVSFSNDGVPNKRNSNSNSPHSNTNIIVQGQDLESVRKKSDQIQFVCSQEDSPLLKQRKNKIYTQIQREKKKNLTNLSQQEENDLRNLQADHELTIRHESYRKMSSQKSTSKFSARNPSILSAASPYQKPKKMKTFQSQATTREQTKFVSIKFEDEQDKYVDDIDVGQCYTIYFPQFNLDNVIKKLMKKKKKKWEHSKYTLFFPLKVRADRIKKKLKQKERPSDKHNN